MTDSKSMFRILLPIALAVMLLPTVKAASTILSDSQDGAVNSDGIQVVSNIGVTAVGDSTANTFWRSFFKFSLSGISGTLGSATLNLGLYQSEVDGTTHSTSPLPNIGLGNCRVIHIADYGTLDGSDFNAPSIGNDPGILISSTATPNVGYLSIDVKAAMQDDINKGRAFSAFMLMMDQEANSPDGKEDIYIFHTSENINIGDIPYIEYSLAKPVGGVVIPTNKLEILTPYLALAGLVIAVSAVVVVKRRSGC